MRLYLDMRYRLTSFNNGDIAAVFSELKHRGWSSKSTLHKALRELETLGFIAQTRQGGIASMSRICSLYRFTDHPCEEKKGKGIGRYAATYDYKKFESIREAREAVRVNEQGRRDGLVNKKKMKAHKRDLTGSEIGLIYVQ